MDGNKTTRILIPQQYDIPIAMQYSVVEKNHSFNIQKYGLSMYFSTSQKITLFSYSSLVPTVCLPSFPCVQFFLNQPFLITSLLTCKIGLGRIREPINQSTITLLAGTVPREKNIISMGSQ